ncbi:MAG TPA: hypothetical protein VEI97_14970 [bacterium]|nr:hypothetical protein [bacterium]
MNVIYGFKKAHPLDSSAVFPMLCLVSSILVSLLLFLGLCATAIDPTMASAGDGNYPSRENNWIPGQTALLGGK